jgi:multiple sugar transport system ATP-binding protein
VEKQELMKVRLEKLFKRFEKTIAVDGVTVTIEDGEFFVLLGPSGCGKTTTLRIVAGLETPDEGQIFFDTQEVTHLRPRERDIAMVFQDYGLYPHMSIFDNIAFPLRIQHVDKKEREGRVSEVAARLHISELLSRRPSQVSGGEKQRVSLARALIRNPRVFLMDEPLSNLDAKLRVTMRTEIKQLVSELGITTIYVTHDQIEAMAMATRIAVMNLGKMVQVGEPLEIYKRPATRFVAEFIGSPPMNMFEGQLTETGSLDVEPRFLADAVDEMRLRKIKRDFPDTRSLTVGVRPENIHLEDGGKIGTAMVELVEPLGQDTYLYLRSGESAFVVATRRAGYTVGDEVGLQIADRDIHLIDRESGRNLLNLAGD